jgi:hypothetical protein
VRPSPSVGLRPTRVWAVRSTSQLFHMRPLTIRHARTKTNFVQIDHTAVKGAPLLIVSTSTTANNV